MDLNEAIIIVKKCLHSSESVLEKKKRGIDYNTKREAYSVIAEYHSRINLLYKNSGATETVLSALHTVNKGIHES
ncbi:hypothetical protein VPBG_00185 [Vibrio phage helene 12B3]|uniref:hypothetical protein n=1 Tax=Vibrio phage helene 12B3 TaxID=573173 RepID=UPI0002C0B663|nr:hypothetical protein VPBG_00185 [Vibrio phage helene 12B3]AGG57957.1 hypothetical protein VPBG_00185 [Vibrio phage helene 12B3]